LSRKIIAVGSKAPAFTLKDQNGRPVKLRDFLGKKIILYFYVRDDTPGCTREACEFRNNIESLHKRKIEVLGVSPDTVESHKRFAEKYGLTFPLLVDEDATVAKKYGIWAKKNLYGRTFYGVVRSTFVIDEEGRIIKELKRVKVDGHLSRVLKDL
jgi:peroxiredoxin Q/BCP